MEYSNEDIKIIFPNSNFLWINDNYIAKVIARLDNVEWYFVGGCVRDSLINKQTYDIDITTTAHPDEIENLMNGFTIATIGKKFGTIGVYIKNWKIEITTTRHDVETFGRHANVDFKASFYEDSCRRDFTINALLYNGHKLIDWNNGIEDLKMNKVRFIGIAKKRIEEDYLRIIRYIRFFYRFYNENDIEYKDEIRESLSGLKNVSSERFLSEIESICKNKNRIHALNTLNKTLLSYNMFSVNLNISKIDLLYQNNFTNIDFIFAALFINADKNIINSIPLSRNVKKLINWLVNTDNLIFQCSKIYNSSKNLQYMLFYAIMNDQSLYEKTI